MDRNFLKSGFAKFLLGILIVAFVLSSVGGVLFMTNRYNIINIDSSKVNINEFVNIINNEKRSIYGSNQSKEILEFLNSRNFLLLTIEKIINSDVLDLEVKDFELKKPESLIFKEITNERYFFTNNKFDLKKFQSMLKSLNISESQYVETLQNSESITFLLASLTDSVKVNDRYVNDVFISTNVYKNVDLHKINKNKIKIKIDETKDSEIKDYYNNNILKFIIPEQRKIDYVKIENYSDNDVKKLEGLLSTSNSLDKIAKEFGIKVETYDYVDKNNIAEKNTENINNIENAFNLSLNGFSSIEKYNNNIFVYSAVDIKKEYTKSLEESKNEIINLINIDKENKKYLEITENYAEEYKKSNFDNKFLKNKGFDTENIDIYRNSEKLDKNFIDEIFTKNDKNITKIYSNDNNLYFGYVKSTKKISEGSENFITKDVVGGNVYNSMSKDVQQLYIKYLRDVKHKIKVNYKLLDLIKPAV